MRKVRNAKKETMLANTAKRGSPVLSSGSRPQRNTVELSMTESGLTRNGNNKIGLNLNSRTTRKS